MKNNPISSIFFQIMISLFQKYSKRHTLSDILLTADTSLTRLSGSIRSNLSRNTNIFHAKNLLDKHNFTYYATRAFIHPVSRWINRSKLFNEIQFKSSPLTSKIIMNITAIAFLSMLTVSLARPRNHHNSSRELAELVTQFPGTSLEILREVRDNIRRALSRTSVTVFPLCFPKEKHSSPSLLKTIKPAKSANFL